MKENIPLTETIESTENWQCMICGNLSVDYEEKGLSLKEHLKKHKISEDKYIDFVNKNGGLSNMKVSLLNYTNNPEIAIISFMNQTWGATFNLDNYTDKEVDEMVMMALNRETLPTVLETIKFTFQIDGISRASTHQLVRVRIGSAFSQRGMRDSYYGSSDYVIPSTVDAVGMSDEYINLMKKCNEFYDKLFKSGVPYQDARYVIPHAALSSVVWTVDFLALVNFCTNRLQNFMQWEINTLARMIRFEISKVYPKFANILKPRCELTKKCNAFGNLFPGCGKFPQSKTHDKVFMNNQATKNLKFDKQSVLEMKKHNSNVKPNNYYWKELLNKNKY